MDSQGHLRSLSSFRDEDHAYSEGFAPVPRRLEPAARKRMDGAPVTRDEARHLAAFQATVPAKVRAHEKRRRQIAKASKRRNRGSR